MRSEYRAQLAKGDLVFGESFGLTSVQYSHDTVVHFCIFFFLSYNAFVMTTEFCISLGQRCQLTVKSWPVKVSLDLSYYFSCVEFLDGCH